jgi:hypothetical protein
VHILKLTGWIALVLLIGLAGSIGVVAIAGSAIDDATKVRLPSGPIVFTDSWDRGYVSAEGTFVIDNDRQAFPLQITKMQCYRDDKACTVAMAEVGFGNTLNLELSTQAISLWNSTTIHIRTDATCVEYIYTIDRANKRVLGTRSKKQGVTGCDVFDSKPLTLTLANGFDVWWKLNQEAIAKYSPFMWAGLALWWVTVLLFGWRWRPRSGRTLRGSAP